ncbi:hypothetical protein FUAX_39320 (plasmid) [Fulvitalea axinellae]|uniref:WD40-like Beta Propeller Repeat n=1 Tax=Fulvitalea axinellae TaxID=1182444 RepID=A0AAU9DJT6_9BACT|nr:hypothetical protein FUAX_39320 [Fulvitalea axinellae]
MKIINILIGLCLFSLIAYGQNTKSATIAIKSLTDFPCVRDFTLSSNGQEAYTTIQSNLGDISVIVRIKKINTRWGEPTIVPFSGKYKDLEAFLSPDNLRLYFVSNRPLDSSSDQPKDFDIWYVERSDINAEWGAPKNVGSPVNTSYDEFYPSVTANKNLYFTSDNPGSKGKDDIYYCAWNNSGYSEPINLGDSINTNGYEFNSFVSPDETFLIFTGYNRKGGLGSGDLYISFRDNTSHWSKAINLGPEINSKFMDYCPFFDSTSGELYFTSKRRSFEKINNFKSIEALLKELNKDENGLSRIYRITVDKERLFGNKKYY